MKRGSGEGHERGQADEYGKGHEDEEDRESKELDPA